MFFFSVGVCLAKPKLLNSSDEAAESKKRRSRMSRSHAFRPFLLATSPLPSSNPGSPQMYIEASFELIGRTPARLVLIELYASPGPYPKWLRLDVHIKSSHSLNVRSGIDILDSHKRRRSEIRSAIRIRIPELSRGLSLASLLVLEAQ